MWKQIGLNRNLAVICVTILANLFVRYLWYALLPLYLRTLGASDWEIGISFTAIGLAHTVFAIFGGALADRFGRRVLIAVPSIAMGPLYFVAGLTHSWVIVVAMLTGIEIFNAVQWPAMSAFITEASDEDRVARSFSFSETAVLVGLTLGPIAGAALLSSLDISTMILLSGVAMISTGLLRAWGLRDSPRRVAGSALPQLRTAIDANVRWFIALGACVSISFAICFGPYFAILARDAWHNSEAEINLLWAVGSVASLVGILFGRLSDRWGGRRVFVLSALGFGTSTIAWGIAPSWQWGLIPLLIAFAFSEAMFIAQQTIQAEITSPETRSSVIGVIVTTTGLLGGMGPTIGAWLITLGGNALPFIMAGALGLLATPALIPIRKKVERAPQVVASSVQAE